MARSSTYPTTQAEREKLADALTAKGFKPTQGKAHFDRDKIMKMVEAMQNSSFAWAQSSLQPVIIGPKGEVLGGHHRVVASHLAGVDLSKVSGVRPQVWKFPQNFRPEHRWIDVLPDVP